MDKVSEFQYQNFHIKWAEYCVIITFCYNFVENLVHYVNTNTSNWSVNQSRHCPYRKLSNTLKYGDTSTTPTS